jgi:hypothetical protein
MKARKLGFLPFTPARPKTFWYLASWQTPSAQAGSWLAEKEETTRVHTREDLQLKIKPERECV